MARIVAGFVITILIGISYFQIGPTFGFSPKDSARFLTPQNASFIQISPFSYVANMSAEAMIMGTLGPLSIAPLLIWLTKPSPSDAALAQTALIVLNLATLYALALRLTKLVTPAVGCVAVALCAADVRPHADVFIGNIIVVPVASELILLALLAFIWKSAGERSIMFTLCAALLFLGGVSVIPAFVFAGITFAAILAFSQPRSLRQLRDLGILLVAGAIGFFAIDRQPIHLPSRDVIAQIITVVPLVFRATSGIVRDHVSSMTRNVSFDEVPWIGGFSWLAAICGAIVTFGSCTVSIARERLNSCLVIGASLWFGAAFALQDGMLLEVCGFGLALIGCIRIGLRAPIRSKRVFAVALALSVFFIIYGNERANALVIEKSQRTWIALSTALRAGSAGLFSDIPSGSRVELASTSNLEVLVPYETTPQLIYALSGRRDISGSKLPLWLVSEDLSNLEKSRTIRVVECQEPVARCRSVRGSAYREFAAMTYSDQFLDTAAAARGYAARFERYDGFHTTVAVRRLCGAVSAEDILRSEEPTFDWGVGYYPPQDPSPIEMQAAVDLVNGFAFDANPPWRYATSNSRLLIRADRCAPPSGEDVAVQLTLFSQFPGTVRFATPAYSVAAAVTPAGFGRTFIVHVPRGGAVPLDIVAHVDRIALDPLIISRSEQQPDSDVRIVVYLQHIGVAQPEGHP